MANQCRPKTDSRHHRGNVSTPPIERSVLSPEALLRLECNILLNVCAGLGTERSRLVAKLVKARDWDALLSLPRPDFSSDSFPEDYLVTEMMRKNPRITLTGVNKKQSAVRSWVASERSCRETNRRIRTDWDSMEQNPLLKRARAIIRDVLGTLDTSVLNTICDSARHGPGATSSVRGKNISRATKNITRMGVTPDMWELRNSISPYWQDETVGFVCEYWDTWTNVPKNAKTDRGICIGPTLAVFMQLGVGAVIREKLKRSGLDIRRAQEKHRWLALNAQKWGLATIDLSAASDSISYELVRFLLDERWFHLLDMLRTSHTRIKGIVVDIAKFSAMGNGYTFELETLIFWALARAVYEEECVKNDAALYPQGRHVVSCYGDDIIVPQDVAPLVVETLIPLGFKVNVEKTYLAGTFFESCGTDVWNGQDVRPFYLNTDLNDESQVRILYANAVRIQANRLGHGVFCDKRLMRTWLNIVGGGTEAVRREVQETGCSFDLSYDSVGKPTLPSGLIRNFDEFTPPALRTLRRRFACFEGHVGRMLYSRPRIFRSNDDLYDIGLVISALQKGSLASDANSYDPSLGPLSAFNSVTGRSQHTVKWLKILVGRQLRMSGRDVSFEQEFARKSVHRPRLKSFVVPRWHDIGAWSAP